MNKVEEGLYITNYYFAKRLDLLRNEGITHILVVGRELLPWHPEVFIYKKINIDDESTCNIIDKIPEAVEFLQQSINSKGKVLVHCAAGISRSSSIVIAYLMWRDKISFEEAFNAVQKVRPIICPNDGFVKQLKLFEEMGYKVNKEDEKYKDFWAHIQEILEKELEAQFEDLDLLDDPPKVEKSNEL